MYKIIQISGSQILSGAAQGFATGAAAGAASGAMAGGAKYHKNPKGFCFVAGTLVLTTVGLVNIENIQAGDLVYAKEAVGEERSVDLEQETDIKPVISTFVHEVDDTYIVTIDDEKIETTGDHPFYDEDGNVVEASNLKEGDILPTYDGETATVDSVECVHHEEPVLVYNFCVMEDHTYFIGDVGVLVHNSECGNKTSQAIQSNKEAFKEKFDLKKDLGNYEFKGDVDVDLRGQGNYKDALELAFEKTGVSKDNFEVTKWGRNQNGKSFPTEWRTKTGAEVNIDLGHSPDGLAPTIPHVGWQTAGKRGAGGAIRGHIFVDNVPYNR